MFELDYWIEEIITKMWVLVLLDLDKRVRSYGVLKIRGNSANKLFTNGPLAENLIKEKTK